MRVKELIERLNEYADLNLEVYGLEFLDSEEDPVPYEIEDILFSFGEDGNVDALYLA